MFNKLFSSNAHDEVDKNLIGSMMIIDDEQAAHQTLSPMIRALHYAPVSAYTLKDTQKYFSSHKSPAVIFLDVYIPGVDTLKVLSYCKEQNPDIHIIIITGSNNVNIISNYIAVGADDFLLKPFNRKMFMAKGRLALAMIKSKEMPKPVAHEQELDLFADTYVPVAQNRESEELAAKDKMIEQLQIQLKESEAERLILQNELSTFPVPSSEKVLDENVPILVHELYEKLNKSIQDKQAFEAKFEHDLNNAMLALTTLKELMPNDEDKT